MGGNQSGIVSNSETPTPPTIELGTLILILCEAYEVGWDFVIAPEQKQQTPSTKSAALHTGKDPSCFDI